MGQARARRDVHEALTNLAALRKLGAPPPPIPPG